ncbi:putative arsenate reductase (Arc2) [Aspergillus lucknowensis]|uniref:Rhodanese-like domain-containing protein n=1 Tax=Aspergillus lucknowensis TaxID=176173 RepID=A0ABR4LFW3_9EURO
MGTAKRQHEVPVITDRYEALQGHKSSSSTTNHHPAVTSQPGGKTIPAGKSPTSNFTLTTPATHYYIPPYPLKPPYTASITMTTQEPPGTPWHADFPAPKTENPAWFPRETLLDWMKEGKKKSGVDFLLVDLRRTDFEGGTIRGSLNLPAQSLYPTLPTLFALVRSAGVKDVVFYCGSSQGRGTRGAGWFADYLRDQGVSDGEVKSWRLEGGIKGWVKAGEEYTRLVDGFDRGVWEKAGIL